jgi:hypothetical protein
MQPSIAPSAQIGSTCRCHLDLHLDKHTMPAKSSWRDTLYIWDGILTDKEDENGKISVTWIGTWVACNDCADAKDAEAPKRNAFKEFVDSDMEFSVSGTAKLVEDEDSKAFVVSMTEGEGYDMKEGDEKTKEKDDQHEIYMVNLRWSGNMNDQRNNLLFAKGKNIHGPFVSIGWMRPGCRLTIARRYLEEKDERVKWTLKELREKTLEEMYTEGEDVRIPPWQCDTLHAETFPRHKKRKPDEGEDAEEKANEDEEEAKKDEDE